MDVRPEVSVKAVDERSNTPDSVIVDDQQLVKDLANDYSKFLDFDLSSEKSKFSESVEDMLTKLDEFCGLVDMIRSDTSLCLTKTVPDIHSKCCEMEQIFGKIDRLETLVSVVRQSVGKMDDCVCKAEDDLSSQGVGGFMKKISSIVSPKRSQKKDKGSEQSVFVPPDIFETKAYFAPVVTQSQATSAVTVDGATAGSGNT